MTLSTKSLLLALSASLLVMGAHAQASEPNQSVWEGEVDEDGYLELTWQDLMPEGEEDRLREMYALQAQEMLRNGQFIAEGGPNDVGVQIGTYNTVAELDGQKGRLPGYTVTFDFSPGAQIEEFLLVPTLGACVHVPPPPPNQTVYVETDEPIAIRDLAQAVWLRGTLVATTQSTDLADAAYTIILDDVTEYNYRTR